jgi:hypothetical protein
MFFGHLCSGDEATMSPIPASSESQITFLGENSPYTDSSQWGETLAEHIFRTTSGG